MRENPPATERQLLEILERLLTERLPEDWVVSVEREQRPRSRADWFAPDAWLTISPPTGPPARWPLQAKLDLYPKEAAVRADTAWTTVYSWSLDRPSRPPRPGAMLIVSRFLTQRTRDVLRELGVSYADATGNLRLVSRDPALFIELSGASTDPWPSERPLRSLKGSGTARVVRALLDYRPPYKLRDLAQNANLPLATASRVVNYLVEEGLVLREGRGPITDVAWQTLLRQWATEYPLMSANQVDTFLEPRGPRALLDRLPDLDSPYAVTASLAAEQKVRFAPAALASVYVRDIRRSAEALGIRAAPTGGNVLLIVPNSKAAFERTWSEGAITYAALSQVAADLLSSPGRAPSEAEELIEWMENNEDAWRRS
jgi:hypothetical protein